MKKDIRLVAPFRPFRPESELHQSLADFDWIEAIQLLGQSAKLSSHVDLQVITDVDTDLPVPMLQYRTRHRRLMLWTLEACAAYLESRDFDRRTVMLDCDQLLFRDLSAWFAQMPHADLGVLVRPTAKHLEPGGMPLLNGVQFWHPIRGRKALTAFYRDALAIAEGLPESQKQWGADQEALRQLLEPIELGLHERHGLRVMMFDAELVLEALSGEHMDALEQGSMPWPLRSVLDFRWTRKRYMRPVFDQTWARAAREVAC